MENFFITLVIVTLAPLLTSLLAAKANRQESKLDGATEVFGYPGGPSFVHGRIIRIIGVVICSGFAIASLVYNVWVVCGISIFFAIVIAIPWSTSLRIDNDGVHQDGWRFLQRDIAWIDVSAAEFNEGDQSFNVIGKNGIKITHNGQVARDRFRNVILKRTKLPMTILRPGVFGMHRTLVPNEELNLEHEDQGR